MSTPTCPACGHDIDNRGRPLIVGSDAPFCTHSPHGVYCECKLNVIAALAAAWEAEADGLEGFSAEVRGSDFVRARAAEDHYTKLALRRCAEQLRAVMS